ncbi:sirohydrochlorin chelatase [Salinicoccus roseus]|uniref:sirohydrochlorin chelatase n=1 Tax=Salinicoccus roseus TaxID=45670 RepID=UPI003DA0121C
MAHDIIVMHGSKKEARNSVLEERLDALMAPHGQYSVAFIESTERSVCQVVDGLAEEGARNFNIIPVLFFSASHYSRDIPEALRHIEEKYEDVSWTLAPPMGTHPHMARLVERRVAEAPHSSGTVIVMAHGNADHPEADDELERLVSQLDIGLPAYPAALYGALAVDQMPGRLDMSDNFIIVPIALEDGFLTGRMKEALLEVLPESAMTFTPSVNFDPVLKEIIMDHMENH